MKIAEVLNVIDRIFPPTLADEGDAVGLQIGNPEDTLRGIAVSLEATPETIAAAAAQKSNLLLTHHPLLYKPMKKISARDPVGAAVFAAVKKGVTVYAAHTDADWAKGGLNDRLADLLGLIDVRPLVPRAETARVKLVTFVPPEALDKVSEAVFAEGAGVIGDYQKCSFRLEGTGTFLPGDAADPYSGKIGELAKEKEYRLEVLVPASNLDRVVKAMIAAHPYEEVAYDVYPLKASGAKSGVARIGALAKPAAPRALVRKLKKLLPVRIVRAAGPLDAPVKNVVICSGRGTSLIERAAAVPHAVFVTGDVGYHDARLAEHLGLPVIDVGHFGSEIGFVKLAAELLAAQLSSVDPSVKVHGIEIEKEPFEYL